MNKLPATFIMRSCAVLSVVGFIYAIGIGVQYRGENRTLMSQGVQSAQRLGNEAQAQIQSTLRRVSETVDTASKKISKNGLEDREFLFATIRNITYSDVSFVESGIAFAPFAYNSQIRLYGFSYVVDEDGMRMRDLDISADYTQSEAVWYHRSMEGNAAWLEPEYDEASQRVLVTYAAPVFKPDNPAEPIGAVFVRYSVNSFKRVLNDMDLGDNGYSFLLSPEKHFIVHHNEEYLDHRWSINDFLSRLDDKSVLDAVSAALSDSSRILPITDPDSGQEAQVFFLNIPEVAWALGIVLINRDLAIPSSIARDKLLRFVLLLCLSIVLLSVPISGLRHGSNRSFWIVSSVFTVCCIIGYVTALRLSIDYPQENSGNSLAITNLNSLNRFMTDQRRRTLNQREEVPLFIPTGIYIQSIAAVRAVGGLAVNGYLWQRYTPGIHDGVDRGFIIPGSYSLDIAEPTTTRLGNSELVRWSFKAILNQEFDYSRYPFGTESIRVQLRHKQFTRNVILIPDLESYKLVNPVSKPGLQHDLDLHGWNLNSSLFHYNVENYSTNFGSHDYAGLADFPELYFTIEISKQILGAIISHALPLIVVTTLLFALLLMLSVVKVRSVFSHIGMRESFEIRDIIYLEYFYYITYVLILFTVANYVLVTNAQRKQERQASDSIATSDSALARFVYYRDNFIAKVLFWPLSQFALLVLTLLAFF
jgi:hypothetical protein